MSKTFDSFQKSTIKNAAKAVAHFQARKDKLDEQIAGLQVQSAELNEQIETYNKAVTDLTGGYTPLELCEKVARNGGSNEWVFKYPETIIPTTPENVDTQVAETPENNAETATMHAPENPAEALDNQEDREAEASMEAHNLHPDSQPAEEETYEPETAQSAVAEYSIDPMNNIFA